MSKLKPFLRVTEIFTAFALLTALVVILLVQTQRVSPITVQPAVMAIFVLLFPVWAIAVNLLNEFTKPRRVDRSWWGKSKGLNFEEMKQLVRWCPRPLLHTSLIIAAAAMIAMFMEGGMRWSLGQDFTQRHAIGFSVGAAFFYALALPLFASASRMPGQFSDHI